MTALRGLWRSFTRQEVMEQTAAEVQQARKSSRVESLDTAIAPNDPLLTYFQNVSGVVEVDKLMLDSPAVRALREAGVKIAVPLVSQGELIGLINLGPRLSEQEYSTDDRKLLNDLATQAAPAVRVAQLVRQQQAEIRERERYQQELQVARVIQQTLLPKELPALPGWQVAAYWQPARAVGGDFYDFINLPDGRLGWIIGDVTDKGVPAALVMATTRSILRAAAERLTSPGQVLAQVNDLLHPDIPPKMFVTCLYAILDPASGVFSYANAGHCLPYRRGQDGVHELRATGMPLGLMPGMAYEEKETTLLPGESLFFYSDGLVEAHNPQGEMFGFPRLRGLLASRLSDATLIEFLQTELSVFTGRDWEQEDDATFLTLERIQESVTVAPDLPQTSNGDDQALWRTLAEFEVLSAPGNERQAGEQVAQAVRELDLPEKRLARLQTAVSEATMNAMEHGNRYRPELAVSIRVLASNLALAVHITDHALGNAQPIPDLEMPDLDAKLAGLQNPRGWGLFLIKNMVDDMHITSDEHQHSVELIVYLKGDQHGDQAT
jgi:serine phosphatase RsbU (regulator of sigma subunit)/anti-sigma regulatory factor (Ser/Thr protein kinase)